MRRTTDVGFFGCPICMKPPFLKAYNDGCITAYCKGHSFYRHRKVSAYAMRNVASIGNKEEQRITVGVLAEKWNMINFSEVRFLFYLDGKPRWAREKEGKE